MKCSLGISNFLAETSRLFHSVVFLYFFALITEEGFFISPCYSLELCFQMDVSFLFSFSFASLLFSGICKASSDNHFAFLHFFLLGRALITASCTMFCLINFGMFFKPGTWLFRPSSGATQSQDSLHPDPCILSMVLQVLRSQQTVTPSFPVTPSQGCVQEG